MTTSSGENACAIGEIDYTDPSEWLSVFSTEAAKIGGFNGDEQVAAALMAKFGQGRAFIQNFFRNHVELGIPDIWIMHSDTETVQPDFFYHQFPSSMVQALVVKKDHLERWSRQDPDTPVLVERIADGVQFKTTGSAEFSLAGTEEAHHSIFFQLGASSGDERSARENAVSRAEYHAIESEWQALAFQIVFAREMGIPAYILDNLLAIKEEAAELRASLGLSLEDIPYLNLGGSQTI